MSQPGFLSNRSIYRREMTIKIEHDGTGEAKNEKRQINLGRELEPGGLRKQTNDILG